MGLEGVVSKRLPLGASRDWLKVKAPASTCASGNSRRYSSRHRRIAVARAPKRHDQTEDVPVLSLGVVLCGGLISVAAAI
jgi:hypothetical protein